MFDRLFKKNKKGALYFALVIADRPTDGFKFTADKDCTMFMASGEVEKRVVIPTTVLKEIVERFRKHEDKELQITETTVKDESGIKS